MGTKPRFAKEATGNLEMAYYTKRKKSIWFALNSSYFHLLCRFTLSDTQVGNSQRILLA